MTTFIPALVARLRQRRWAHLAVVNLRIFIGFSLMPAGLKKVLGEPFTDPWNSGPFHDFLHAFHATGAFYHFVGALQLVTAILLMTQRFATLGALLALPIFTAILVFCWSTAVYPTASVVTLITLGALGLVLWDIAAWRGILAADGAASAPADASAERAVPLVATGIWARAGLAVAVIYLVACVLDGGVYRPRGVELQNPAFYLFPVLLACPIVAAILDRRRYRRARAVS